MSKKNIFLPSPIDWVDRDIVKIENGFITFDANSEEDLYNLLRIKDKVEQCINIAKRTISKKCVGRDKYSCDSTLVNVSFTPSRVEMKFKSSLFKKEHPDLYAKYCEETEIPAAIRMSVKNVSTKRPTLVYADSDGVIHGLKEDEEEKKREEGDLEVTTNNYVGAEDE